MEKINPNIFIKQLTYLPFDDVVSVCSSNKQYHNYCTNPKYRNIWKNLIDNTYGNIYGYQDYLQKIWNDSSYLSLFEKTEKLQEKTEKPQEKTEKPEKNSYNYLVYVSLINILDPITQLMIYCRQNDINRFENNNEFTNTQRFLALFLLGEKGKMEDYINGIYNDFRESDLDPKLFIDILKTNKETTNKETTNKETTNKETTNKMMVKMAQEGSVLGVNVFLNKGADIHYNDDVALLRSSAKGRLEVVKYILENFKDIEEYTLDEVMVNAVHSGNLDLVKYLIKAGLNVNAVNDMEESPLWEAIYNENLDIVKHLVENGAKIEENTLLINPIYAKNLPLVKYLVELGVNVNAGEHEEDFDISPIFLAVETGYLPIVKYLVEHGAGSYSGAKDFALMDAIRYGHTDIVKYLVLTGTNIRNNELLDLAIKEGHKEIVDFLSRRT